MNLNELIDELEQMRDYARDMLGIEEGDIEVRIAQQPAWPLASPIDAVTLLKADSKKEPVLWLAAGGASEYASRQAWDGGVIEEEERDHPRRQHPNLFKD